MSSVQDRRAHGDAHLKTQGQGFSKPGYITQNARYRHAYGRAHMRVQAFRVFEAKVF